ncbi:MAG: diguanylate cyclase, partial [Actinomycetota bacterium]
SVLALGPALDATVALYNDRVEALDSRVRAAMGVTRFAELLEGGSSGRLDDFLQARLSGARSLDFLIALDTDDRVISEARRDGQFVPGVQPPARGAILRATDGVGPGFVRTPEIPVRIAGTGKVGTIIGGFWLDQELLGGSSQDSSVLSLVAEGRVIASTAALPVPVDVEPVFGQAFETEIDGEAKARARPLAEDLSLVASTPVAPIDRLSRRVITSMLGLLALAIFGTTLLAYLLARLITRPLEEVAEGAQAISDGRFDYRIKVRSKDEVGQLATAFNEMTGRLEETVTELQSSRDQLQRSVQRIGETLRATHDMGQMLESMFNTAVDAVSADAAVLWRFTSTRRDLYASNVIGLDPESLGMVRVGEGVAGHVAERAANVLLPSAGGPRPVDTEPDAPIVISIPLYSQRRVTGVLAVYRTDPDAPFTREDLDTVVFLAEQGGVAIENVQLHEEAKRLSLMDGLTGTWNRRFFQMQFKQVLATATRFERPFSILMLDIDFFKPVNDTYGHQRGDSILVEFAQRVNGTLREVDTFARYGGEEFICLLSETDTEGAVTTAEKILEVIRSKPFGSSGEDEINLTVSVGVAVHPQHGTTYADLVEAADQALYAAKSAGRNTVKVAGNKTESQLKLAT